MAEKVMIEKMMEYPSRLQMSMLAPVKALAELIPAGDKEVRVVGYVFGEARGISYRNNPNSADGEAAIALTGLFQGVPSYTDADGLPKCAERAELRSGVLFLPPQAQAAVVEAVRGPDAEIPETPKRGKRVDQLGVTVPITFEIGIRKSDGPVGYEWVTRGLQKVEQVSPLDRMRQALQLPAGADLGARIAAGDVKMISDGKREEAAADAKQIAAPAKGKTKAKGKQK
jgi:hypothetical protein